MKDLEVSVKHFDGVGCPRCKHHHHATLNYDGLCDRCCGVLLAEHPNHPSIPHIQASYAAQRKHFGLE
jgi:hypothetical protein